jgi:predicted nucleic acid-binding protein
VVEELERFLTIIQFDIDTIKYAYKIKDKYKFSYFDSLIIATALNHNCQILYTEDMQHNQIIEDKLKIINPFEDIKEREYKK